MICAVAALLIFIWSAGDEHVVEAVVVPVERRGRLRQPANLKGCVGGDRVNR